MGLPLRSPVEGPVEQKDLGGLGQGGGGVLVGLEHLRDNAAQPAGPLLQRVLLQQSHLKVLLQAQHHAVLTLAHPGRLLLGGGDSGYSQLSPSVAVST